MSTSIETARTMSPLKAFLSGYTSEVTTRDEAVIQAIADYLPAGSEVFIASLPKEPLERQIEAARQLRAGGMQPIPHIVARNVIDRAELDWLLGALSKDAGVDRALILAGDRDKPEGDYPDALSLLQSGLLQEHGIRHVRLSAYPEGHPRIADDRLLKARADKLAAAESAGLAVELVSQFCFDPAPILAYAEDLRAAGVVAPLRVGVAGPASRKTLLRYAILCGVGPSMRALKERGDLTRHAMGGDTPQALLAEIARVAEARPELKLSGAHFFTFGSLPATVSWVDAQTR